MKKNMKKLLVIVMALMPSLSIITFAQTPGGGPASSDPEDIPVAQKPSPNPNPTPGPRVMSNEPDDIPIVPEPGLGGGGPRQDIDPNLIPIKPCPGPGTGHEPRIRTVVQEPECYHNDGVVYIYADSNVTFITATITRIGDNLTWTGSSNTNTLTVSASSVIGVYLLELTLSDGRSYIGEYMIE